MKYILIVFLGGGIGACTRYLFAQACAQLHWPLATFLVNILGCFLIGLSLPYFFAKNSLPEYRLFLVTGFLGSLTTFSTLTYESIQLFTNTTLLLAFANVLANLIAGFLCAALGIYLANFLI